MRLGGPLPIVAEVIWSAVEAMGLRIGTVVWAIVKATEIQVTGV